MKLFNLLPKKNRFMSMSLALLASATLLSSCLKNDSDDYIDTPRGAVSFVNAAASQSAIGINVDGRNIFNTAAKYGESSGYVDAGVGGHLVQGRIGGTTDVIAQGTVTVAEGKFHSVFFVDRPDSDSIAVHSVVDAVDVAPAAGKAKVRIVQLSPDNEEFSLHIQGGAALFQGQAYAYKETSEFVEIDPAKYKFVVREAGDTADKAVTDEVDIVAGRFYTIVVSGSTAETGTKGLKAFTVLARYQ